MTAKAIITYAGPLKHRNEWRENRKNAQVLHSYLTKKTDVNSELLYCKGSNFGPTFFKKLKVTFGQGHPTLIAFFGHGDKTGLTAYRKENISYLNLAITLSLAKAPTLVIIDACESYGLAHECRQQNIDPTLLGIISAASRTECTAGGWLVPKILQRWENRVNFPKIKTPADCAEDEYSDDDARPIGSLRGRMPKKVYYQTVRWGARNDHFFFPSG